VTYRLELAQKPVYLHAVVTGENSRENVAAYLEELRRECVARGCARLLIEERLAGARLGRSEVFGIVMEAADRATGLFEAVAFVDVNAGGDMMKFAESMALYRGIPIRLFAAVADAEKWIGGAVSDAR
jgi:hypothetical protein